jgi:hypothetical protein
VAHRRNGSEASRVFRRENSDFFVPSARHSAVFLENKSIRSSLRRGSSEVAGLTPKCKESGEPVLTNVTGKEGGEAVRVPERPARPRRERTEGDIVLQRTRDPELRRKEIEARFSREVDLIRKNQRQIPDVSADKVSSLGRHFHKPNKLSDFIHCLS